MTRLRTLLVVVGLVIALAGVNALPARAQSSSEKPKATEIGVTPTEIHIAVEADVDNPFVPGLFQGIVDGVKAGAKYLNSKAGGGGVAGRNVVVDFIDSKLNPNEARNGVITACQNDFALVGTSALFLSNVDDVVNCADKAGATTGLPDVAAIVTGVPESCAPVTYSINPPQLDCSTKDQHPQTYWGNQGDAKWLLKQNKNDLHGSFLAGNDTKDALRGATAIIDTSIQAGIKADQKATQSGRDPQSAYTPVVNQMKNDNSNFSLTTMAISNAVELRSEAQLQGLSSDIVWECTTCYDNAIHDNAQVMDGTYMTLKYLPFEEAKSNTMLSTYMKYVGKDKANGFSVFGWVAALAFGEAANNTAKTQGVNGLTRANLLKSLSGLTKFDAGGMFGTTNVGQRIPTPCFLMEQFTNDTFKRLYPAKAGTFDCKASNNVKVKDDLIG
jgi:PBP1b-binding outer membrane lipoprotein LpoB